jgi:beta-glucosidase-like glycosyl hydrolase
VSFFFIATIRSLCPNASFFQVLDGDGEERTVESDEDKALMRKVAAEGIVLLKNEGDVLPLKPQTLNKLAIVGGNAKAVVLSGGGSAALKASYFISPYEGIVNAVSLHGVEVTYCEGARGKYHLSIPCSRTWHSCIQLFSVRDDAIARL